MIPELELDTRSKLLKAAVTVFGKVGYAGASVRQIADLAGVNHGSIRYHYATKRDLWCASISYLFGMMERDVHRDEAQWRTMTPRERIINVTGNYIRFNARYPELRRMVIFETIYQGELSDWLNENFIRPFTDRALATIALAQAQGVYPKHIPALNIHYINLAAASSVFLMAPEIEKNTGIDVFETSEIERHIEATLAMLLSVSVETKHSIPKVMRAQN
jgi:AcrR family transcriptional regulator